MSARYRLEYWPAGTPRPGAIWDTAEGMPGAGGRLVAILWNDSAQATMAEAEAMTAALNAMKEAPP